MSAIRSPSGSWVPGGPSLLLLAAALCCTALALWTVPTVWPWAPGWVVFCQRNGRATSGEELLGDGRGDVLGPGGAALGSPHPPVPFWEGDFCLGCPEASVPHLHRQVLLCA